MVKNHDSQICRLYNLAPTFHLLSDKERGEIYISHTSVKFKKNIECSILDVKKKVVDLFVVLCFMTYQL